MDPPFLERLQVVKQPLIAAFLALIVVWRLWARNSLRQPLPPSPPGYPILGNLFDVVAPGNAVRHYSNLAKKHGDIFLLKSLGAKMIIVSSLKRTNDLFEKRSNVYSDRPWLPMMCGEMQYADYFSVMSYSTMWRKQRREFHSNFNPAALELYHPMILEERIGILKNLLADPREFREHTKSYFTSIIIRATYGIKPKGLDDPLITGPNATNDGFSISGRTGAFLVDLLPWLTYVPEWMPGTGWKKVARYYREVGIESREAPFKLVLEQCKQGIATPCVATRMIENLPDVNDPSYEEAYKVAQNSSAQVYVAASDTSFSVSIAFFLVLAMYPEVQKRAQKEIDEVVGFGRLPDFNDRPQLVYLEAFMMELLRWHQPAPFGIAHSVSEDDVYEGYFIPKGTVVIGNIWHILHDPETYPEPDKFNPDRFIKDGKINQEATDPALAAFGFGRRICPGRFIALDTLYVLISSTLAMFDVSAPKDKDGNPDIKPSFSVGLICHPGPFECSITPRSDRHQESIQNLLA
ncbi:hypothetical protein MD484_g3052, partial [Candolleomyces efflorescens]